MKKKLTGAKVLFSVPEKLLNSFDKACETQYATRSEVLRKLIRDYLAAYHEAISYE